MAPVNALEAQLTAIWQEVLGHARISTTANFFELGGNSLLATKVVARIRRDLHAKLEIRSLFALPTISSLAKRIADTQPIDYAPVTPLPAQASYALSRPRRGCGSRIASMRRKPAGRCPRRCCSRACWTWTRSCGRSAR